MHKVKSALKWGLKVYGAILVLNLFFDLLSVFGLGAIGQFAKGLRDAPLSVVAGLSGGNIPLLGNLAASK